MHLTTLPLLAFAASLVTAQSVTVTGVVAPSMSVSVSTDTTIYTYSTSSSSSSATTMAAPVSASGNLTHYTTVIHRAYTTVCPYPTVLTLGDATYTVTEATTLTITDCPCTVVHTYPAPACSTCHHETKTAVVVVLPESPTTMGHVSMMSTAAAVGSKTYASVAAVPTYVTVAGAGRVFAQEGAFAVLMGVSVGIAFLGTFFL